jgi:hypothetical protein
VEVLFEGYEEDSIPSKPDLTEVMMDTVHWKYVDIDTLGQLYERDTASVKIIYHNNRTVTQAQSIIDYLISSGAREQNVEGFAHAIPATLPANRKTRVRARVVKM